jgi:hypothetical protein
MAVLLMREYLEAFVGGRPILVFSTGNTPTRNSSEVGRDDAFLIAPLLLPLRSAGPKVKELDHRDRPFGVASVQRRGPGPG